ncbi:MAG TPA: ABC transporter permease [Methylothermaceae bacterium]|nr:ABC transporter permease [Methylothermaceae bacterium]
MNALVIAARELRSLFLSPLAWSILGVIQLLLAYIFLAQIEYFQMIQPRLAALSDSPGVTDLIVVPLFGNAGVILLLVVPLLTMRLIAEERRNRTLSLLFSAPVSVSEIVIGKYLGVLGLLGIMVVMISAMPLSLSLGTHLDWGKLAACVLALSLLLAAFAAIGLFLSTWATQPTVAAVGSFGVLLLLWIIDWSVTIGAESEKVLGYLSLLRHYENLLKGLVSTVDLVYFLLLILTFLILSIRRLDYDRLQK